MLLLLGALLICFIPSEQSLWIDEAATAHYAHIDSLRHLSSELLAVRNSEAQMPLFILQNWIIGQLFNTTEWVLRAPNILWGILAMIALYIGGQSLKTPWLPVLLILHPYFWFYMNEARPYAMQISFASWLWLGLVDFHQNQGGGSRWAWIIGGSALLLCAASMLAVVTVGLVFLALVILCVLRNNLPKRKGLIILGAWICILAILGGYYGWTFLKGTGGARHWRLGLQNIGLSLFEFSGASGLSPGRVDLREMAKLGKFKEIVSSILPGILLFGSIFGSLLFFWLTRWHRRQIDDFSVLAFTIMVGSFVLLYVLSFMVKWPFWGRHLAPSFPFFLCWLGLTLREFRHDFPRWHQVIFACLLVAFFVSSLTIRLSPVHARDDYRTATQFAREQIENSAVVWWSASPPGAEYYGLPLDEGSPARAIPAFGLNKMTVLVLPEPDWIILSKPDIHDPEGAVQDYINRKNYKVSKVCPAFRFYSRHRLN